MTARYDVTTDPATSRGGNGGCSSVGRALGCGPRCRGFNSRHSPQRAGGPDDQDRPGHNDVNNPPPHNHPIRNTCGPCANVSTVSRADALPAPLAQLAEQLALNQRVRGSSPWRRTDPHRAHQQVLMIMRILPVSVSYRWGRNGAEWGQRESSSVCRRSGVANSLDLW